MIVRVVYMIAVRVLGSARAAGTSSVRVDRRGACAAPRTRRPAPPGHQASPVLAGPGNSVRAVPAAATPATPPPTRHASHPARLAPPPRHAEMDLPNVDGTPSNRQPTPRAGPPYRAGEPPVGTSPP